MKMNLIRRLRRAVFLVAAITGVDALASPAVTQAWAIRIDGPTNMYFEAAGMSASPSGDLFLAGHARSFGFNHDLLVIRRDPSGALAWQRRYEPAGGSAADELAADVVARGTNVYVAATTTGTNGTGQDFLTLKYRDNGELEWASVRDGSGHFTDLAVEVAVDALGNVLVVGDSIGTNSNFDVVVLKYTPTGQLLWEYRYDGPAQRSDRAVGIRLGNDGGIHVAGTSGDTSGESSVFTFKLNPEGQEQWVSRVATPVYSGSSGITARAFDVAPDGHVAVAAEEKGYAVTWLFDPNGNSAWGARYRAEEPASMLAARVRFDGSGNILTAANLYGSGTNDAVLIKYAGSGQQLWATRVSGPEGVAHARNLDVDGAGNAYLTMSPLSDMVTVKVDTNGAQLWSVAYNSGGLFTDYPDFLQVTASGDIFVGGRSVFFSESFVSVVKYTQQPPAGTPTAVVTPSVYVVDPGTNILFTAETSGPDPIKIQWRRNGRAIPDQTNATLALTNVGVFDRGDYSVIVSNLFGATVSPEARLSVRMPPEVSIVPTQTVAYLGTDTTFHAVLTGNEFVMLQWRHNGTNIPGATNDVLELASVDASAGGTYQVVAETLGGVTTSSAAGLQISRAIELVGVTRHQSSYTGWDYAPQLSVFANGEFVIAARSNHLTQGSSILVHKHDPEGALLWSRLFDPPDFTNAEPTHLALDAAGNIYVAGHSRESDIPAALVLLKYSPSGQLLWSRILTGTNLWGSIHPLVVDPAGNSTLAVRGGRGTNVVQLFRHNSSGELQWSYIDRTPDTDTLAVAVDAFGNSYLGTTVLGGETNEVRVRKFNSDGTNVWTTGYAEGTYNRLGAMAADSNGNLIVAGTGIIEAPDSWMFVQKYSPAGQKLWETRTGSGGAEINYIITVAVGPEDDISVLTMSDDDYTTEQLGLTRIAANGQFRFRIAEPYFQVSRPPQLALDNFGNAYVTGGGAVTIKYDPSGNRLWMVAHAARPWNWGRTGLSVGVDAAGDVRVLTVDGTSSQPVADFSVLRYRQRDPAGLLKVRIIPGAAGTFHLDGPWGETFQIEASTDLQNWILLDPAEAEQLLQAGGTTFSEAPRRFFRLVFTD